jgi:phosphate/sulfate permease
MGVLYALLRNAKPRFVNRFFGKAQIFSASYMGFAHGLADAQKTMGVITLALVTATATGTFATMPDWLGFLRMDKSQQAEASIKVVQNAQATAEQLSAAAKVLDTEAARLQPGAFKEAFLTLAAKAYAAANDPDAARHTAALAASAHQAVLAKEQARWFPKLPVLGALAAGKHTDWQKTLTKDMQTAASAGKNPLVAAATKVRDLSPDVPVWIKVLCSLTMAAGTAGGGWRIIKTLGHKLVKLQPVHGFAAETTAATLLAVTGSFGMTVSTTHSITTSIMGVGCARRFSALKFSLVERIIWAWVLTLPAAGGAAYLLVRGCQCCGWIP